MDASPDEQPHGCLNSQVSTVHCNCSSTSGLLSVRGHSSVSVVHQHLAMPSVVAGSHVSPQLPSLRRRTVRHLLAVIHYILIETGAAGRLASPASVQHACATFWRGSTRFQSQWTPRPPQPPQPQRSASPSAGAAALRPAHLLAESAPVWAHTRQRPPLHAGPGVDVLPGADAR